jgi:hypothetical protein
VPVAVANLPVGHGGTFLEPNGGAAASVAVSWLDWQLRGDMQSLLRARHRVTVDGPEHTGFELVTASLLPEGVSTLLRRP